MSDINQLSQRLLRHQRERAARKFQTIDMVTHDIHHILQMSFTVGGVIWPSNFSHAMFSGLGSPGIGADEAESLFFVLQKVLRLRYFGGEKTGRIS